METIIKFFKDISLNKPKDNNPKNAKPRSSCIIFSLLRNNMKMIIKMKVKLLIEFLIFFIQT